MRPRGESGSSWGSTGVAALTYGYVSEGRQRVGADLRVTRQSTAQLGAVLVTTEEGLVEIRGASEALPRLLNSLERDFREAGYEPPFLIRPIQHADVEAIRRSLRAHVAGGRLVNHDGADKGFSGVKATRDPNYEGPFLTSPHARSLIDAGYEVSTVDLNLYVDNHAVTCTLNLPKHRLYFSRTTTTEKAIKYLWETIDDVVGRYPRWQRM